MSAASDGIVKELEALGGEGYRRVLRKHGARDPFFGVKISELKKIQKRIKRDHQIALDLYATGIYDAMYLAGLIADDKKMTKAELQRWVDQAYCPAIAESAVAWVASQGNHGWAMAMKWMDSKKPVVAAAGWATMSCVVALTDDDRLDGKQLKGLLESVVKTIAAQPSVVRSTMNRFVIALGSYYQPLTAQAIAAAKRIGEVSVDVGDTDCKVPSAAEYIHKARERGTIGVKRKTVKC
jgi:DNA alkylation repair enzyme